MRTIKLLVFILILVPQFAFAGFGADFAYYKANPRATPPPEVIQLMRKYHVVFVAGWLNEFEAVGKVVGIVNSKHPYFSYNQQVLAELGITSSVHRPSSLETIEDSGEVLANNLFAYREEGGGKQIILAGHSRGGPVAMSSVVHHPEFLRQKIVKRVVTIQSPIYGNSWPKSSVYAGKVVSRLWLLGDVGFLGMRALEPESIERAIGIDKIMNLPEADQVRLDDSLLYIATSKEKESISSKAEKKVVRTFKNQEILNDSLVATANMGSPHIGNYLGYSTDLSHAEPALILSGMNVDEAKAVIRAFTYAFIDSLAANLKGDRAQAKRVSAGVKAAMGHEEPEKPKAAPHEPTLFHNCATLVHSLVLSVF